MPISMTFGSSSIFLYYMSLFEWSIRVIKITSKPNLALGTIIVMISSSSFAAPYSLTYSDITDGFRRLF